MPFATRKTSGDESDIRLDTLLKALLKLEVELNRRTKMAASKHWANQIRARLSPVREELAKKVDETFVSREFFDQIFQMLLTAIPVPNSGIEASFREYYFEVLLDLKPNSIAARRHLAKACEQVQRFDAAETHLAQLAQKTGNPDFSYRLETMRAYLQRREMLIEILSGNVAFLTAIDCAGSDTFELSESEIPNVLRSYFERDPLSLLNPMATCTDQETQFLFAEALCHRRMITHGRKANLREDQLISAFDLRDFVQDKTICLVANSGALLESKNGAFIDSHDVVVRFNSFAIDPPHTGTKTTIHCSIHLKDHNRDIPVSIRLIFGNVGLQWVKTVAGLRADAQQFVGDETLKYPLYAKDLVEERMQDAAPTTGYNLLRLLYLFSNFDHLHLVGFDGYRSGAYRTAEGMKEAHAGIHDSQQEDNWIRSHTSEVAPNILRLIPLKSS